MSVSKRNIVTVDRDAIAMALLSHDDRVDEDTRTCVADAMAETAKSVLTAQGVDVRIKRRRRAQRLSAIKPVRKRLDATTGEAPVLMGQGLPTPTSSAEGLAQLRAQAVRMPVAQWAGEVLGPTKAAEALGIMRSTLDNWRTKGEIIALPKGKTAHVIPMAQFVAGRPVPGIARILEIAHGSASLAWSWLLTPHVDFDAKPPLQPLLSGEEGAVHAAAQRSIG